MLAPSRRPTAWWTVALLFTSHAFAHAQTDPKPIPIPLPGGLIISVGPGGPAKRPDAVLLTPEKYRELVEQLEKLQAQVAAQAPTRPRACELEGRVEVRGQQTVVRLKATFRFTTTQPKAIVLLGCQKAKALEAKSDDGKLPLLTAAEDDSLRVQIETPGEHTIRLELDVPVGPRGLKGADQGFELGLPAAPITALTFEPPANVKRYTLTTRTAKPTGAGDPESEQVESERFAPGKGGAPLGPITSLALSWDDPQRKAPVSRSAEAEILTTVSTDEAITDARLRLRGTATEWRFTSPAAADVVVGLWPAMGRMPLEFPPDRSPTVVRPEPGQSIWKIVFRDPPSGDAIVVVSTRLARAKAGPMPVGPFVVLDATQTGAIRVRTPLNLKATGTIKGDVRRDQDESTGEAIYRYSIAIAPTVPPTEAPVTLTVGPAAGTVNARARHELRITESGWRLRTEVAVSPSRAEVETIDFEAPAGFQLARAEPREIVEGFSVLRESAPDRRVYQIRLVSPKRTSFSFTIDGEYALPVAAGRATIPLPRLLGVTERAAELVAIAPARFDLRGTFRIWEGPKAGTWETGLDIDPQDRESRLKGTADRPIASVDLSWPPASGGISVRSTADVDLESGFARVVQRLKYKFAGPPPARLRLTANRRLGAVRASRGTVETVGDGWEIVVPGDAGRETEFVLSYAVPNTGGTLPADQPFVPTILVPDQAELVQVLRVWVTAERPIQLVPTEDWGEAPIEVVDDRPTLPALVVRARGPATMPTFSLGPAAPSGPLPGPTIERITIEVQADDVAQCRARFWVRDWGKDPELLVPAGTRAVEVYVSGRRVPVSEAGPTDGPRVIRLPVTAPNAPPGLIEVRYRESLRSGGELRPPRLARSDLLGDVTWTITAPNARVPLAFGDTAGNWSPSAVLSTLGLARYIDPDASEVAAVTVAVRQRDPATVRLWFAPRNAWVLSCSLVAFGLGLGLALAPRRHQRALGLLALLVATGLALLLPQPLARAVFGAIPGLAAIGLTLLAFHWARTRYQGRLNRVTGFSRSGSSLTRPSAVRRHGSTTEDSPPIVESSLSGK